MKHENKQIRIALTIAGSDSGGGAGIQADLKTFAATGVHGTSAITSITAQNTTEVRMTQDVDSKVVNAQIEAVLEDIGVDAAKTGMLHTKKIIDTVSQSLRLYEFPLVVDPVMVAKSGATLLREAAIGALRQKLIPKATVLTPNRLEAEKLLGKRITTLGEAKKSAKELTNLGCHSVVVKGGHIGSENVATDVLYSHDGGFQLFEQPRLKRKTDHGTGCSFSAAIAAYLAKGLSIADAVKKAKDLVWNAIKYGLPVGEGHGPVNPLALLYKKAKHTDLL